MAGGANRFILKCPRGAGKVSARITREAIPDDVVCEEACESLRQKAPGSWSAHQEAGRHRTTKDVRASLDIWGTEAESPTYHGRFSPKGNGAGKSAGIRRAVRSEGRPGRRQIERLDRKSASIGPGLNGSGRFPSFAAWQRPTRAESRGVLPARLQQLDQGSGLLLFVHARSA